MGGTCSTDEEMRNAYKSQLDNLNGKDNLGDIDTDERIILKRILNRM